MSDIYMPAGTKVEYSIDSGTTWKTIPEVEKFGSSGEVREAKERTGLADKRKKYGIALPDSPDISITGKHVDATEAEGGHAEFEAACDAGKEFEVRVTWPTKRTHTYTFLPLGFVLDEVSGEDYQTFTVTGKRNSDITKGAAA